MVLRRDRRGFPPPPPAQEKAPEWRDPLVIVPRATALVGRAVEVRLSQILIGDKAAWPKTHRGSE